MNDRYVSRSGTTYPAWLRQAAVDLLEGRRDAMPTYAEFVRDFAADADGYVSVHALTDPRTGEAITLDEPLRVHVRDLERLDPAQFGGKPC